MDILVETLGNSSSDPQLLGVNDFLKTLNPFLFSGIGVAFAIALSACGAAWGIALVGSALTGHAVARPHVRTRNIVSVVFCEAVAIFGIIAALLSRLTMQTFSTTPASAYTNKDFYAGWGFFYGCVTVGLCNLACGIAVGITGNAAVCADASNDQIFIKVLVVEVFASVLGIFGLIVGILMISNAQ